MEGLGLKTVGGGRRNTPKWKESGREGVKVDQARHSSTFLNGRPRRQGDGW